MTETYPTIGGIDPVEFAKIYSRKHREMTPEQAVEYLSSELSKAEANAAQDARNAEMEAAGYVLTPKNGWVLKSENDAKIARLDAEIKALLTDINL